MSQYRITATITSQTQATDSGAWQMGITWRKILTLDPAETQEAADLRNQAWEQAANGIDDETTRRIWQQVDTVTAREAERLRAQVRKLIVLRTASGCSMISFNIKWAYPPFSAAETSHWI